jgi:hypothetical protein
VIDRRIMRDPVKPGREFVIGAVAGKRIVDFDEDFLRDVERRFIVAQHSENVSGDRPLISADQGLETVFRACYGRGDQVEVGSFACILEGCCGCRHNAWVVRYFPRKSFTTQAALSEAVRRETGWSGKVVEVEASDGHVQTDIFGAQHMKATAECLGRDLTNFRRQQIFTDHEEFI